MKWLPKINILRKDHSSSSSSSLLLSDSGAYDDVAKLPMKWHQPDDIRQKALSNLTLPTESDETKVHFSTVQIRRYRRILGDNPTCDMIPLSIGWEYESSLPEMVDHHQCHQQSPSYNNALNMKPLDVSERRRLLINAGYTEEFIQQEERKRRLELCSEWFWCRERSTTPCTSPRAPILIRRYLQ